MVRPKFLRLAATVYRDFKGLYLLMRTELGVAKLRRRNATVPTVFRETVAKNPAKTAFLFGDQKWSLKELDTFSDQVAQHFIDLGYKPGDEVALLMESRPEYVGLWMGLAKAGIITALVNTHQRSHSLVHSLTTVKSKAVIFGPELTCAVKQVIPLLNESYNLKFICYGDDNKEAIPEAQMLTRKQLGGKTVTFSPVAANYSDRLFYVYTSGTTGLPKAAVIKHSRFFLTAFGVRNVININSDDILYTCLPLYHFAGGVLGVSQAILFGNTVVLRQKFSASHFWKDCIKYKCTVSQYIGEVCRYLLLQPPNPQERSHSVRLMFGNGLGPKLWSTFINRFNIKQVVEVYGATEGNAQIVNIDNKEGACGFIPVLTPKWLLNYFYPVALVKVDPETQEPARDEKGNCIRCQPGETGQFVGRINPSDPARAFDGYSDESASEKKVIDNVFFEGDKAFASGDLLEMDDMGYLYFKDRTGDTFRWKGENVSSTEVQAVLSNVAGHTDCVVYGVEVPGCEGKAGMAALLDPDQTLDLNSVLAKARESLPAYSLPLFIRLVKQVEMTATYKLPKMALQKDGFNVHLVPDPIYLLDSTRKEYIKLDPMLYDNVMKGKVKL